MPSPFIATAKALVDRIVRGRQRSSPVKTPSLGDQMAETQPPQAVVAEAKRRAEQWTMTRVVQVAVVCNTILAGIFFATYKVVSARPIQQIVSSGDLDERMSQFFDGGTVQGDRVAAFLHFILTIKHDVSAHTEGGAPFLPLLQGLVAEDIYKQAEATVHRNIDAVKSGGITQSLLIESISDLVLDEKASRLGATVSGRLEIKAETPRRGVPIVQSIPYRAHAFIDIVPPNQLNIYGFFLLSPLREVFGEKAVQAFDQESEKRHARINGR